MGPPKTLAVLGQDGAGKKTIVGSLLYKLGIDLKVLQQLETNTSRTYAEIVNYFDQNNLVKSFYAPSATIVVGDTTATPDIAMWVVDVSSKDQGLSSSAELQSLIASKRLKPKEKLIILINHMDRVEWSEDIFNDVIRYFRGINVDQATTFIIPISGFRGDNLLEATDQAPWFQKDFGKTVLQAIG